MNEAWAQALDDFESRLAHAEAVIELHDDAGPAPSSPSPGIESPLPSELRDRADQLLTRAGHIERRLVDEQRRIREELARLPRAPAVETPRGQRFDVGA